MTKKYFYIIILIIFSSLSLSAQETNGGNKTIEGLNIYPNPAVSTNRIYITSKSIQSKKIEIYDVLGKKVLQSTINGREFSVTNLTSGVYFIKIKEGEATATRKLIVK
ncbi:MAG: secretion protein [Flavobacterium sp. MedPE-SWcel]|uniref:T9SS type A sorting domain-containing protein n=1 Tax=uncultured Flavobacterium sp. TaxID=165435 RepID=UPI00091FBF9F|nr:T9SS type A sorting domain-containing protein [uncultured Flavobacterium sp.]OIQ21697.1 MAG: secretion protein [Flavobacterium sp. MedPE-SWcel]